MPENQKQSQLYESVSALVDNRASPLEIQRILAHTEKNTGVRNRWHRFNLIRAVMRGEAKGLITTDISDKVRSAIVDLDIDFHADETVSSDSQSGEQRPATRRFSAWFAPAGRLAIAASVAMVVIFSAQQLPGSASNSSNSGLELATGAAAESSYQRADLANSPSLSRLNVQNVSSASFAAPDNTARAQSAVDVRLQRRQQWEEEQVRQAINRLMLEHAQQSSLDQSVGLMPFIRVSDSAFVNEMSQ